MTIPFKGANAGTVSLTVGASSTNVQVNATSQTGTYTARVYNSGSAVCFIAWGADNTVTAATGTGLPIPAGWCGNLTLTKPFVAAIGTSGTLYITPGEGGI